jgi:anti-sigma-K factor RskA
MTNDEQLDKLFRAYAQACPERDANANFMPALWARIDARRQAESSIWRWANAFVGASAVLVLGMGLVWYQQPKPLPQRAYIEKLTDEISEDHFLEAGYMAKAKPVRFNNAAFPGGSPR